MSIFTLNFEARQVPRAILIALLASTIGGFALPWVWDHTDPRVTTALKGFVIRQLQSPSATPSPDRADASAAGGDAEGPRAAAERTLAAARLLAADAERKLAEARTMTAARPPDAADAAPSACTGDPSRQSAGPARWVIVSPACPSAGSRAVYWTAPAQPPCGGR